MRLVRWSSLSVLSLGGGSGLGALHETVLFLSCQVSQSSHAAGALAGSSLGLDGPIVASDLARGVAGRGASLLLLVPVLLAGVATERVRLVAAFSLSLSSLGLHGENRKRISTHVVFKWVASRARDSHHSHFLQTKLTIVSLT